MYKTILYLLIVSILTACTGRYANPVMANQMGDRHLTCEEIEFEMNQIQHEIQRLIPQSAKTAKNVGLGVAGLFLIFPWFMMDLSSAEKQEIQALQQRYNVLSRLANKKDCQCAKH